MEINTILQLTPALLGYTISGLMLWYFLLQKIRKGIIMSSLFFMISGFFFQIFFDNLSGLKHFASEYHDIFSIPIFTIFATALGIFLGNTILSYTNKRKEQKEIAIIFINSITSQINCLERINDMTASYDLLIQNSCNELEKLVDFSKIYLAQLKENTSFNVAFERIGIYSEREIDCLSFYSIQRQQLITIIDECLLSFDVQQSDNHSIIPSYQQFISIKISIILTISLGFVCLIKLSEFYSSEKINNYEKDFQDFFIKILEEVNYNFRIMENNLWKDFMKRLDSIKNHYRKIYGDKITYNKELYVSIIKFDLKNILKIDLINNINYSLYNLDINFNESNIIFSFSTSEEKAVNDVKNKLKSVLNSLKIHDYTDINSSSIDDLFNQLNNDPKNITPWQ